MTKLFTATGSVLVANEKIAELEAKGWEIKGVMQAHNEFPPIFIIVAKVKDQ